MHTPAEQSSVMPRTVPSTSARLDAFNRSMSCLVMKYPIFPVRRRSKSTNLPATRPRSPSTTTGGSLKGSGNWRVRDLRYHLARDRPLCCAGLLATQAQRAEECHGEHGESHMLVPG